jgi:tetratricopeptide (TPR) repeat protein
LHTAHRLARIRKLVAIQLRNSDFEFEIHRFLRSQELHSVFVKIAQCHRSVAFAAALGYLVSAAREEVQTQQQAAMQQFQSQAKAWREASPKPVMPESAREHQVLAEYAFRQHETDKAIREYQAAVTEFPTWPEGHFNLATLAGEQKDYDTAILHMKEYLELAPDSPDAQAKIAIKPQFIRAHRFSEGLRAPCP